jgi:hypothetical protein
LLPGDLHSPYLFAWVSALPGFAEAGALPGRKTFLIDTESSLERTTYVAFANSVIGIITLLFGALALLPNFSASGR